MSEAQGIILCGHGSRDPLWRQPIEAVAARVSAVRPRVPVICAYLELQQPDLPAAAAELAGRGVTQVMIVPMFLGTGKHARADMASALELLRTQYTTVAFTLRPAVGEDPRLLDLIAQIAQE